MIDADATDFTALAMAAASARITSNIVQAYVSHNAVSRTDLPNLIAEVYGAVQGMGTPVAPPEPARKPAVSLSKSITPDAVTCIECGFVGKSLRRHLRTAHGLSPDAYRQRWNLPATYQIVAPNYAAVRSRLAKENGLGKKHQ
jgi:predicted transcriptional regulator